MRQLVTFVGLAVALAITAACEAHAGVKINNHPAAAQHHYRPADAQTQLVR